MLTIDVQPQRLTFRGVLDRNTLLNYWPFQQLNTLSGTVVFDFSELQSIDTAGLAWLLKQLALASKAGLVVQLQQVPEQLRSLARVSDVLELLPIAQ
ncbi:MAG: STAS domain-containing protein [Alkalimonas sp.]|uniref:STAS domain-containing protein n=1 Tax=Alkalimonas delamerensis TaxID=265981 RepID=A0ABT9GKI5_9GAMM|nr:STAS domain-containing protein [Alkalimonas delamerensis]MCC5852102.1 STAS domain-containing protein [Alkalimonas sp.]MDP4527480.1 STAS domain-containing protein [Alkalimonas delamerensis]